MQFDGSEHTFYRYWQNALSSVSWQLEAVAQSCKPENLRTTRSTPTLAEISRILAPARPVVSGLQQATPQNSGHLIRTADDLFRESLAWLQRELRDALDQLPLESHEKSRRDQIEKVLGFDAETTAVYFGTITEGWDRLVGLKHKLLFTDLAISSRASWFVSIMTDFERGLREAVCLPIQELGRFEPISNAILEVADALDISPTPRELMRWQRTEDAMANAFSAYMSRGIAQAIRTSRLFRQALRCDGVQLQSFKVGFCEHLTDYGDHPDAIVETLTRWRELILHDVTSLRADEVPKSLTVNRLYSAADSELKTVAQFLYGLSIESAMATMGAVSHTFGTTDVFSKMATVARYKTAAELRVADLNLLAGKLWWLGWVLAECVQRGFEDPSKLMLRFNALYAQSNLSIPGWQEAVREINVSNSAVRYKILKKSLLKEWNGIVELIIEALDSDMTKMEFETWPALENLRSQHYLSEAISKHLSMTPTGVSSDAPAPGAKR